VQWHRFYQDLMGRHFPDHDLAAQYDRLALLLRQSDPPTVDEVTAIPLYPQQKRIVMAALGWRHPDRRADFFLWARRMNFDPAFPRLLIEKVTTGAAAPGI
jgi:hypothetical protein